MKRPIEQGIDENGRCWCEVPSRDGIAHVGYGTTPAEALEEAQRAREEYEREFLPWRTPED